MIARLEYGLVAFIDILGFSQMVKEDCQTHNPLNLERISDAIRSIRTKFPGPGIQIRVFSDTVIVEAPLGINELVELTELSSALQMHFLEANILTRGAIALGKHYSDEQVTFSEAVIVAYELERTSAKFPRIVVDKNLLDWFINFKNLPPQLLERFKSNVLRDRDEVCFVDYLQAQNLENHLKIVTSKKLNLAKVPPSILEKVQWLVAYHNFCSERANLPNFVIPNPWRGFESI